MGDRCLSPLAVGDRHAHVHICVHVCTEKHTNTGTLAKKVRTSLTCPIGFGAALDVLFDLRYLEDDKYLQAAYSFLQLQVEVVRLPPQRLNDSRHMCLRG